MFQSHIRQVLRYYTQITKRPTLQLRPIALQNTNKITSNLLKPNGIFSDKPKFVRNAILALSVLRWLGFEKDDEEKESELIMTLKRAVLCIQREQYDKAEQMLHLALRMAQQQQNSQGTLYCYDLMANLAMERFQLEKAEKLFVSVMQMLLASGVEEDNLKVIHVSLKLARISHLLAQGEKAELGYNWCLDKINKKQDNNPDRRVLFGVIEDWYAQFLLERGNLKESLVHLEKAYEVCCEVKGRFTEQGMLLLNDLGITSWRAGDMAKAEAFLNEAAIAGAKLEDQSHVGVIKANLGLIYLQNGLTEKAHQSCKDAFRLGTKHENVESVEQAKYCLEQISAVLGK